MKLPDDWPLREHSEFITAGGLHWHVQRMGKGRRILMLHGTGASSHSWAPMARELQSNFELMIPDLPGQGFSAALPEEQTSLSSFSEYLQALLHATGFRPDVVIGHSAGAAIAVQMALSQQITPSAIIALNGAFLPFGSLMAPAFSRAATILSRSRLTAWLTAAHGWFDRPIRSLIEETGSRPTPEMVSCYQTLLRKPEHVSGTLRMMAGWKLAPLKQAIPSVPCDIHLVVCSNDKTVANWQSERLAELTLRATLHRVVGLGHLGHEEQPEMITPLVHDIALKTSR